MNDRAVVPETATEMIDGELRLVPPSEPPHADRQCDIAYVVRSDIAPDHVAATELLTRVDNESDFATDACIRRAGIDPETGSRYLEEIVFEVKHTQSNEDITRRARKLVRRGVRRVFVIHVRDEDGVAKAGPVKEWIPAEDRWLELDPDGEIVDHCFVNPLKVRALIDATEANNQVARALLAQNNPVLVEALDARERELTEAHARELEARDATHARELEARDATYARELEARSRERLVLVRGAILDLCDVLGIEISSAQRASMDAMTGEELDALRSEIRAQRRWPESMSR